MEESSIATSNGSTQRAVMCDKSDFDFEFAFNSQAFSDRILNIEVADAPPFKDLESMGDQIPDLKRKKCEETMIDDNELGSSASVDSSEIILRVKSVHVCSLVLAAKSKFFMKLFSNGMQESDQRHVTVRVSPSEETALVELIRYIYTGKLSSISHPFLLSVITVADKFEVPTCVNHCIQQAMVLPMTTDSALLYIDLPPALSMVSSVKPLLNAASEFLGNKYKNIMNIPKHELLSLSLPAIEAVFGKDDLEILHEDMVYDILAQWARARYAKLEERRIVFNHRLAPLIRFAHMTYEGLLKSLVSTDLNGDIVLKHVVDEMTFRHEHSFRHGELQSADCLSAERSYTCIPIRIFKFRPQSRFPCWITYVDFKKDKLAKLFPSAKLHTPEIRFGDERFILTGLCNLDHRGQCFGVFLEVKQLENMHENDAGKLRVAYEFATWSDSVANFGVRKVGIYNLYSGGSFGYTNFFEVPWTTFMAEDSPYFVDGILHMRVQLWLMPATAATSKQHGEC